MDRKEIVDLRTIDTQGMGLISEIGSPIIPLTFIFESLGYRSMTGLKWGILAGAVSALVIELGYEVRRPGRSIVLVMRPVNQKGGEKKE